MSPPAWPSRPRWRTPLGLALALLAQGVWLLLLQLDRPQSPPVLSRLLTLRLFAPPPPDMPPKPTPKRPDARQAQLPGSALSATSAAPGAEATATAASVIAPPSATAAAVTASPAPLAPLNLSLPPQRAASGPRGESVLSQALHDPRSNSAKRTVEFAIADAAGTLPQTITDSTDGTGAKLIRQGSKCIRVRESRAHVLNPMDESLKSAPATAGNC